MKRLKGEYPSARRFKLSYFLLGIAALYLTLICFKFPEFFETAEVLSSDDSDLGIYDLSIGNDEDKKISKSHQNSVSMDGFHRILQNNENQDDIVKPRQEASPEEKDGARRIKPIQHQYSRTTAEILRRMGVLGYVVDDGDNVAEPVVLQAMVMDKRHELMSSVNWLKL
ncbi:unnamed protein product [Fraxinus pennsylvanica]|uniref:Uncharacterized protein n=1 Tax=Fraxinus pennsylvanica TaxID=56036 RepID=A0AAD2EC24_9LAMI|nr:unnamed protein product [Fraxinus pennsylvanica]